jgi:uncharacterized membrane protein YphA (DoxX/SURF4 family)
MKQSLLEYWKKAESYLRHRYLTLFSRIVLGGIFVFAGGAKIGNISTLVNFEIPQYQLHFFYSKAADGTLLPTNLATAYGYMLPPLEILIGVMLVAGIFLKLSSVVSGLMTFSFIIAESSVLIRHLPITVCPCFGSAVKFLIVQSLAMDIVMLAMAIQIFFHRGEFLALGPWIKNVADRSKEEDS